MPTHSETEEFWRDWERLSGQQQRAFLDAIADFSSDLRSGRFRASLRVKGFRSAAGEFEMTWGADGRALWRYGVPVRPGERHVIWLRIGTHDIFQR